MKPLVSILITTYNAERYLKETLSSAFLQTYAPIEIVVVDGGSTDGTRGIFDFYKDSRLRVIYPPAGTRWGIKESRNRLFKEAKGRYLTFLDADDIYLPKKVEEEVRFLEAHSDFAAVYCDIRYFFDGAPEKLYKHSFTFYEGNVLGQLIERLFITNTAVMLRRSVLDVVHGYDESVGMVEDWDFYLRMAHAGLLFGFLNKDLVRYRLRWDNNTRFENQKVIQESALQIFEKLRERMTPEEREEYPIDRAVNRRKLKVALLCYTVGERKQAARLLSEVTLPLKEKWMAKALRGIGALTPKFLLRKGVERLWMKKKRGLFVPAE